MNIFGMDTRVSQVTLCSIGALSLKGMGRFWGRNPDSPSCIAKTNCLLSTAMPHNAKRLWPLLWQNEVIATRTFFSCRARGFQKCGNAKIRTALKAAITQSYLSVACHRATLGICILIKFLNVRVTTKRLSKRGGSTKVHATKHSSLASFGAWVYFTNSYNVYVHIPYVTPE